MGILVSIIVPVYNTAAHLSSCIESILGQTCPDFELILVDDGSTDQSGAICDQFALADSRVRVFGNHDYSKLKDDPPVIYELKK